MLDSSVINAFTLKNKVNYVFFVVNVYFDLNRNSLITQDMCSAGKGET